MGILDCILGYFQHRAVQISCEVEFVGSILLDRLRL